MIVPEAPPDPLDSGGDSHIPPLIKSHSSAFKPVSVLLANNNDTLEGFLNLTSATSTSSHTPATYDHQGAAMYVVAVILVYGLSMVLLIGSLAKKNMNDNSGQDTDDRQVSKYLSDVPNLKERSQRDKYKELKLNIVQIVNSRALVPIPVTTTTGDVERGMEDILEIETSSNCSAHAQITTGSDVDETLVKERLLDETDSKYVEQSDMDIDKQNIHASARNSVKEGSPANVSPGSSDYGANETRPLIFDSRSKAVKYSHKSNFAHKHGRHTKDSKKAATAKTKDTTDQTRLQQSLTASWGGARVYDRFNSDPLAKSFASSGYHSMHSPVSDHDDPVHAWLYSPVNASGLNKTPSVDSPLLNRKKIQDDADSLSSSQCSSQTDLPASAFSCSCPAYGNNSFVPSSPNMTGREHTPDAVSEQSSEVLSQETADMNPWRRQSKQLELSKTIAKMKDNAADGQAKDSSIYDGSMKILPRDNGLYKNGQPSVNGIPKVHMNKDKSRRTGDGKQPVFTARVTLREPVVTEEPKPSELSNNEDMSFGKRQKETALKTSVQVLSNSKYPIMNGAAAHRDSTGATNMQNTQSRDKYNSNYRPGINGGGRTSLPTNGIGHTNNRGELHNVNTHLKTDRGKSHSLPITPQRYHHMPIPEVTAQSSAIASTSPSTRRAAYRDSKSSKDAVKLRSLDQDLGDSYGPYSRNDVCYNSQYVPPFFDSDED